MSVAIEKVDPVLIKLISQSNRQPTEYKCLVPVRWENIQYGLML